MIKADTGALALNAVVQAPDKLSEARSVARPLIADSWQY
jgi:hypothetical protein